MSRFSQFLLIHKLHTLSLKRSQEFGSNRIARIIVGIGIAIWVLYIAFIGWLLGKNVANNGTVSGFAFMAAVIPFILFIDFMLRLGLKQTPSQHVKPFLLLPVSKYIATDVFLVHDLLSPFNLLWQAFFIPYDVIAIYPSYGIQGVVGAIIVVQLVFFISSQWYQLIRTLTSNNIVWWIFPVMILCIAVLPAFSNGKPNIINFLTFYASWGDWAYNNQIILWLSLSALLVLLFSANVFIQHKVVANELEEASQSPHGHLLSVPFLKAKSDVQVFMRLELISIVRNKRLRKSFISSALSLIIIVAILTFTHLFNGTETFWVYYCSVLFTFSFGINIMCKEGNYIDCLMVHKDNIAALLTAKYRLLIYSLIIVFIVFLPIILMRIYPLENVIACLLLAGGPANFICFQLAIYNNNTQSMNTKIAGKSSSANKYTQLITMAIVLIVPPALIKAADTAFGESTANIVLSVFGLVFILTSRLWIRNIARRMMARKYINLDSFRASRDS